MRVLAAAGRDRGFALLIVLWTMVLLALLGTAVTATGRQQARLATALRGAALAHAAAEAAVQETMFDLLTGRTTADGVARVLPFGPVRTTVVARHEDGKLNPNTAPPELLAALMRVAGAPGQDADAVAGAIARWHAPATARPGPDPLEAYRKAGLRWGPTGKPFRDVAELRLVLGMTPALFAAVAPHLSVFPDGVLNPAAADPVVQDALRLAGIATGPAPGGTLRGGPSVTAIDAEARDADGRTARIAVVVRLDPAAAGRPAAFLAWQEP